MVDMHNPYFEAVRAASRGWSDARDDELRALVGAGSKAVRRGNLTIVKHPGNDERIAALVDRTASWMPRYLAAVKALNMTDEQHEAWWDGMFKGTEFESIVDAGWTEEQARS